MWLLQAGADCNAVDEEGLTPIVMAAASGRLAMVAALLPHTKRPDGVPEDAWNVQVLMLYHVLNPASRCELNQSM